MDHARRSANASLRPHPSVQTKPTPPTPPCKSVFTQSDAPGYSGRPVPNSFVTAANGHSGMHSIPVIATSSRHGRYGQNQVEDVLQAKGDGLDDEPQIEFASMNKALHSILVAKRTKLATMSASAPQTSTNFKAGPFHVGETHVRDPEPYGVQLAEEYLQEVNDELIPLHEGQAGSLQHQMTGNKIHFSECVTEVTSQRSWERTSLKSEIPAEVLSELGLVFVSRDALSAAQSSTSATKKRLSQNAVFSWPPRRPSKRRNPIVKILLSAQGMFSTLFSLLNDVTGTHPLVSKLNVDNSTVEVAYTGDGFGENILLFGLRVAADGKFTRLASASRVLSHLKSAILFRWGTFERAFSSASEQAVDHLLCNTLISLADPKDFLFMKQPPCLGLTSPVKQRLDNSLYRFETSTFSSKELPNGVDTEATSFLFHCVGSFLLHKGRLLGSHLCAKLQNQLYSNTMAELNLWKQDVQWDSLTNLVLHTRAFLQIPGPNGKPIPKDCVGILVGIDYIMLGFILEPIFECAELTRRHTILWIHKALKTVQHLAEQDYVMKINQMPERPVVSNMIRSMSALVGREKKSKKKQKNRKILSRKSKKKSEQAKNQIVEDETKSTLSAPMPLDPPPSEPTARVGTAYPEPQPAPENLNTIELERDPSVRTSTTSSKGSSKSRISSPRLVVGRFRPNNGGSRRKTTNYSHHEEDDAVEKGTLLKGIRIMKENVLYHFVHLEFGRGYFLNSKELTQEVFYSKIMDNFQASARVTHGILQRAAKARAGLVQNTNERKWLSHSLAPITEHGTMFQYWITKTKNKKEVVVKPISFWVIGRLYDESKEIFLCYRDGSVPENALESAFKLAHSTY